VEKKFKSELELTEIAFSNTKILFGEQVIVLNYTDKNPVVFPGCLLPYGLLFDLREAQQPKLYIIEATLEKNDLAELLKKMTQLFHFFKNQENNRLFAETLENAMHKNIGWRNKLKPAFENKTSAEFFQQLLLRKPTVLLITDSFKEELKPFMETYTETWGKMVKPILFQKFTLNGDMIFTIAPSFAELNSKSKPRDEKVKATEEDHLEVISESVKELYLYIKGELLNFNSSLEFRAKKHYISLRKDRNLAFFQLGKRKMTIVIANPEKDTRANLKHHAIRTLADSAKKFWNGNEHCFTVVIEKMENMDEIMNMLKKLIGGGKINGNEPGSQEVGDGAKDTKEQSKLKPKAKQGKQDKKPQTKKK
jgi:predicted transport protein